MIGLKDVSLKGGVSETNVDLFSFDFSETGLVLVVSASVSARKEFLNVFSGLKRPYGGSLLVDGRDLSTFSKGEQDDYRYRTVQSIFDERSLLVDKNCFDNLFFGLHDNKETSKRLARGAMAESGLSPDKMTCLVKDLSPEDKKRFLLGKALLRDPRVLLMDDPLLLLNENEKERFANTLKDVSKKRLVVVVTDDAHLFGSKEDQTLSLDDQIIPATDAEAVLSDHEVRKDAQERPRKGFSPFVGFKMAVRWLFSKPIYMAFFFVFCFLSSGFFSGYFSILEAQMPEKGAREAYESGRDYVSFRKREGGSDSEALLSESDLDYVRESYGLDSSLVKTGDSGKYDLFKMTPFKQNDNFTTFMNSWLMRYPMGFLPYGKTNENMPDYSLLCGTIPETENDVLITDYHWWVFRAFGYKGMTEDGSEITLEKDVLQSPEKLLGKRFMTPWDRSKDLKICGILKTSLDEKKYADYFEWLSRYGEEDFTAKHPECVSDGYFKADFFLFLEGSYSDALYVRPSVNESLPSSGRTAIAPMPKKASDLLPFIRGEAKGSSRGSGYYYLFNSLEYYAFASLPYAWPNERDLFLGLGVAFGVAAAYLAGRGFWKSLGLRDKEIRLARSEGVSAASLRVFLLSTTGLVGAFIGALGLSIFPALARWANSQASYSSYISSYAVGFSWATALSGILVSLLLCFVALGLSSWKLLKELPSHFYFFGSDPSKEK